LRRVPVCSPDTLRWMTLEGYLHDFGQEAGIDPTSRLAQDPVGVGVDLFFGTYEPEDVLDWTGLEH
jgi:hypothetical protein